MLSKRDFMLPLIFFLLFPGYLLVSTPSLEYQELVSWMNTNRAYVSPKFQPIENDLSNRYVITNQRIEKKEEILFVPSKIVIAIINLIVSPTCQKKLGASDDEDFNCVLYFMLLDKKNPNSFFKPYYNYLPTFHLDEWPINFSNSQIEKYKITEIGDEIYRGRNYLLNSFEALSHLLPGSMTNEEFQETFMQVATRNFGRRGSMFPEINSMVPYLDLFNHVNDYNTYYYYNDKRDGFVLFSRRTIEPGEEITVSYGKMENLHLYNVYGFTLKNNKYKISVHIKVMGHIYSLSGGIIRDEEIIQIMNRTKERNKVTELDAFKQIKKVLVLRKMEYNKISTNNINMLNIINEQRETIVKYIEIVDKYLNL